MEIALPSLNNCTVAVIGLGYVGLPLAVEFANPQTCKRTGDPLYRRVIGFDINTQRLEELRQGIDCTNETTAEELQDAQLLEFTSDPAYLVEADVFVVTVPTPIDSAKRPDLTPLEKSSATVGRALKQRSSLTTPLIIYESTVYPGATEEVCVPILERESGLSFNEGFYCGYSPERINPGDKKHKLSAITKVTSGSTPEAASWVDAFYGSIIEAGTYLAPSLKVAEAAKVIENTQRDLNIALVNELAIIFRQMKIDTGDVLEAAGTKWNFLPFRPGLVGGHCIGVDPYYLTYKSQQLGYHPEVVLAGRRINDGMPKWLTTQVVLELAKRKISVGGAKVLIMGLTFKEDCPDVRNTKVLDLISHLEEYGIDVSVVDPLVVAQAPDSPHSFKLYNSVPTSISFSAIICAVGHAKFSRMSVQDWLNLSRGGCLLFDLKGIIPRELNPIRV